MITDIDPAPDEVSVTDALDTLCRSALGEAPADPSVFPSEFWRTLAEFGFFSIGLVNSFGGAAELVGAAGVLGRHAAPGPLASAVVASQLPDLAERDGVIGGSCVAVVCSPPFAPWADVATTFLVRDADVFRYATLGTRSSTTALDGTPWARADIALGEAAGPASAAIDRRDLFVCGYVLGALRRLAEEAAAYASSRRQFGRPLSQFQGVSFPLAEGAIAVRAADALTRLAALASDRGGSDSRRLIVAARLSAARAADLMLPVAHQVHGAIGVTADGPVFHISRKVRQLLSETALDRRDLAALDPDLARAA